MDMIRTVLSNGPIDTRGVDNPRTELKLVQELSYTNIENYYRLPGFTKTFPHVVTLPTQANLPTCQAATYCYAAMNSMARNIVAGNGSTFAPLSVLITNALASNWLDYNLRKRSCNIADVARVARYHGLYTVAQAIQIAVPYSQEQAYRSMWFNCDYPLMRRLAPYKPIKFVTRYCVTQEEKLAALTSGYTLIAPTSMIFTPQDKRGDDGIWLPSTTAAHVQAVMGLSKVKGQWYYCIRDMNICDPKTKRGPIPAGFDRNSWANNLFLTPISLPRLNTQTPWLYVERVTQ